jgi:hypothetical protein
MKYKHKEKEFAESYGDVGFQSTKDDKKDFEKEKTKPEKEKVYYKATIDETGDILPVSKEREEKLKAYRNAIRQKKITQYKKERTYTDGDPGRGQYTIEKNKIIFNVSGRQVPVDVKINKPEMPNLARKLDVTILREGYEGGYYKIDVEVNGSPQRRPQLPFPKPDILRVQGVTDPGRWSESTTYELLYNDQKKFDRLRASMRSVGSKPRNYYRGPRIEDLAAVKNPQKNILLSGDIEENPGPCKQTYESDKEFTSCMETFCEIKCHYHAVAILKPPLIGAQRRIAEKEKKPRKPKKYVVQKCESDTPFKCSSHHVHACTDKKCKIDAQKRIIEMESEDNQFEEKDESKRTAEEEILDDLFGGPSVVDDRKKKTRKRAPSVVTKQYYVPKAGENQVPQEDTACSSKDMDNKSTPKTDEKQVPKNDTVGQEEKKVDKATEAKADTKDAEGWSVKEKKRRRNTATSSICSIEPKYPRNSFESLEIEGETECSAAEATPTLETLLTFGGDNKKVYDIKEEFKEVEIRTLKDTGAHSLINAIVKKTLGGAGSKSRTTSYGELAKPPTPLIDIVNEVAQRRSLKPSTADYTRKLGIKLKKNKCYETTEMDNIYKGFYSAKVSMALAEALRVKEQSLRLVRDGKVDGRFVSRLMTTAVGCPYGYSLSYNHRVVFINTICYVINLLVAKDCDLDRVCGVVTRPDFM